MLSGPQEALKRAVAVAGGPSALARKLGVKPQAVCQWDEAPAARVIQIERACDGKVSRHQLRPDLYPLDEADSPLCDAPAGGTGAAPG